MINSSVINPASIVVIGASNSLIKPGGKILKNILDGGYSKPLYAINPHEKSVQGVITFNNIDQIESVDLAILLVSPQACLELITTLLKSKSTKGLIIISAGFSELNEVGKKIEADIVKITNEFGACLIGPNCIGVLNQFYHGVFTTPIPELTDKGCDLISSSGATAVFLMEASIPHGLKFSSVFSVGNAAQTSVEDVLEYLDLTYDPKHSSEIKLIYIENIAKPQKLLKHCSSLIQKGCKLAAIKAGTTVSGIRAAASHTGAMASSEIAVEALFRKAGVVLCQSRNELIATASVFNYKELKGQNIAIITHAGGSAVMLTDALSRGGLNVPELTGKECDELYSYLNPGSSVKNPIDFLATGTAEQLGIIIDFCEHKFTEIDAMVVVFGSPGLFDVENVYRVLNVKLDVCKKPIYPVLPSLMNAQKEIEYFRSKGHVNFSDEVVLGDALSAIYHIKKPNQNNTQDTCVDAKQIRTIIDNAQSGFLNQSDSKALMDAVGIKYPKAEIAYSADEALKIAKKMNAPFAMKIIGPIHKTDVNGVRLNIKTDEQIKNGFTELMKIKDAESVMIQEMVKGVELFIGSINEPLFGHLVMFGLGGVFVEVLKDLQFCLVPFSKEEVFHLIQKLKGYPLFKGIRGNAGVDENEFVKTLLNLSTLLKFAPEISELDLNPLIASGTTILAVDLRIKINHQLK